MNPIHIDIRTKQRGFYYTRDRQIHQSNTAIVRGPAKNKLKKKAWCIVSGGNETSRCNKLEHTGIKQMEHPSSGFDFSMISAPFWGEFGLLFRMFFDFFLLNLF